MSHTTMSLPALYKYANDMENIDIFSGLTVPAAIDRSTLIDWLLIRSQPFEVLYPNPRYMQAAITTWSLTHQRTFDKWAAALDIAYDPLNNYDRTEIESGLGSEQRGKTHSRAGGVTSNDLASDISTRERSDGSTSNDMTSDISSRTLTDGSTSNELASDISNRSKTDGSSSTASGLTSENSTVINSGTDTTTDQVSAFDSSSWSNSKKSETAHGLNVNTNDSSINSSSTSASGSENENMDTSRMNARSESGNENESLNSNRLNSRSESGSENESINSSRMNSRNEDSNETGSENENVSNVHSRQLRSYGNIGVTTSQQMLQSELEVDAWNIYEHIADLFLDEFCVLLY